jgi:hypothetical protein
MANITSGQSRRGAMTDAWREKIKTGNILTRMNKHTLNEDGDIMTPSQVKAAEILLRKVLPDLKAVEMTGEGGGPIQANVEITFIRP